MAYFDPNVSARGVPLKLFVDIDWSGDAAEKLLSASYRMNRFDILLRTIGRKVVASSRHNIEQSRSPEGVPYPPLKNPRGPGHNPDPRPLLDRGTEGLLGDIRYRVEGSDRVRIGHTQKTWYGLLHQKGVNHPWVIRPKAGRVLRFWTADGWRFARSVVHPGLPVRKFLGLRVGDIPEVNRLLGDWAQLAFDPSKAVSFAGASLEGE